MDTADQNVETGFRQDPDIETGFRRAEGSGFSTPRSWPQASESTESVQLESRSGYAVILLVSWPTKA